MIITDQQPSSPSSKRSFLSISVERPSTPEYDAPPAYHPPLPTSPLPTTPTSNKDKPNAGSRRFWRAAFVGLVIYVVLSATVITPLLVIKLRNSKTVQEPDPVQSPPATKPERPEHPDRPDHPDHPHGPPPHWGPPDHRGGGEGDGRWDLPPPHGGEGGPHGPHGPPHGGPKGWHPDCGSEGEGAGRGDCHRPPNVPMMDGMIVKCNNWRLPTAGEQRPVDDQMPFNSFLKYELPVDRDVFVRAAGRTTMGAFSVVVDNKIKTMEAHVEMMFNEHRSYEHTNVCLMDRKHSNPPAMGLGIYMPFGQSNNESISFNITLHIPPMFYNHTLDTHLPIFEQNIHSDPRLYINDLRLSGAASPMSLSGVDAGSVDVKTVYARIKADGVRAARKIRLATNASPIDAILALRSNANSSEPVSIDLQTINAHIAGTVLLEHDGVAKQAPLVPTDEPNADFTLDAKTGNSPIFLRIMHTERSEQSILRANLSTTLGDIELALDPQFEGVFELETDMAAADVEEDAKHTMDPTGMGRRRVVSLKREKEGSVRGAVEWKHLSFRQKEGEGIWEGDKLGKPKNKGGRIRAVTSFAQNTLLLPSGQNMEHDTAERAALFRALQVEEVDDVEERIRKATTECGSNC